MQDDKTYETAAALLQKAQQLNNELVRHLAPIDLTAQQLKILSVVYNNAGNQATVNEIKSQMLDPNSNVSRLLNKLVDKELVLKNRNPEDQRVVTISITKKGVDAMCEGNVLIKKALLPLSALSKNELDKLLSTLQKL